MKELSLCLKAKGADMKAYSEKTLANIELLTVGYAKKLDAEKTYSIEWSRVLTDFDENPFVLVKLNHGFGIYSVMNHVFSEMTVVGTGNPYGEYAHTNNRLKYVWLTDYYVEKSSSEFVCLRDGRTTKDDEELSNLKGLSYEINKKFFEMRGKLREEYIITNSDNLSYTTLYDDGMRGGTCSPKTPYDDEEWLNKEVPNSWYFKNNHRNFPLNESGQCGYTALAMLLGYNEIFGCPGYFSDEESKQWIEPAVTNNYQCEVPNILDEFIFKTWGDDIGGSTAYNILSASIKFLAGKSVFFKHYTALWEFSNLLFPINNGSPEILFGVGFKNEKDGGFTGMHALTVYGYHLLKDETRELLLTCHFGWESSEPVGSGVTYSQMTIPSPGIFQLGSLYSLFNMSLHHCKAYFQKVNSTQSWCGCGRIVSL